MENTPITPTQLSGKVYEIIVADDQNARTTARSLERDLKNRGVQAKIHAFKSVEEAMTQIQLKTPDVVVTDLHFGTHVSQRDGIRFVRSAPELAFVLYTAFMNEIEQEMPETVRLKKVQKRSGSQSILTSRVCSLLMLTAATLGQAQSATTRNHADHQMAEARGAAVPAGEAPASANIRIEVDMTTATVEELRGELRRLEGVENALFERRDALYREHSDSSRLKSLETVLDHVSELQGQILHELHARKPKLPDPDDLIRRAEALIADIEARKSSA